METLDFGNEVIEVKKRTGFRYAERPMFCYPPTIYDKLANAYDRRDWRELNRLGVRWYDKYGERWHSFGPHFWDA